MISGINRLKRMLGIGGAKYKVYTALLSQSGSNAPSPTVFENTIGAVVWSGRLESQMYWVPVEPIDLAKTFVIIGRTSIGVYPNRLLSTVSGDCVIIEKEEGTHWSAFDNLPIEIRVYN